MAITMRSFNLRDVQRTTLNNELTPDIPNLDSPWRVLIVDSAGEQIVNTLLSTTDLRSHNITLQLRLDAETRRPLEDVPAVYIISPTAENIARVLRDVDGSGSGRRAIKRLYPCATVAFTNWAPCSLLAALASKIRLPSRITSVHDLYCDYVSLEDDLFTIRAKNTYADLHSVDVSRYNRCVDTAVNAIFCVLASLRVVPIIRAQRFGAAEAVARKLYTKLRQHLDRFGRPVSFRRPLLLLLDRDIDLAPTLHHTWTYQALVHDCLELERNSVSLPVQNSDNNNNTNPSNKKKKYSLNKDTDPFWKQHAHMPFPAVAEAIELALAEYRSDVAKINRQSTTRHINGANAANGQSHDYDGDETTGKSTTGELVSAIKSLPELTRRKEALDIHTTIGTALLELIGERKLDTFFEFETAILDDTTRIGSDMTSKHVSSHMSAFEELLRVESGTHTDRVRAACLFYGALGHVMEPSDVSELKTHLQDSIGEDAVQAVRAVEALELVKQVYKFNHQKAVPDTSCTSIQDTVSTGWTRPSFRGMMKSVVKKGYRGITAFAETAKTLMADRGVSFKTASTLHLFLSEKAGYGYGYKYRWRGLFFFFERQGRGGGAEERAEEKAKDDLLRRHPLRLRRRLIRRIGVP